MSKLNPYLAAFAQPTIICLCLGVVQFGQTYQETGKWSPSLVAGLVTAAKTGLAWLGYQGAVSRVQQVRVALAQGKQVQ